MDTLALSYILPATGRIRDLHPLEHAPAGRTTKEDGTFRCRPLLRSGSIIAPIMDIAPLEAVDSLSDSMDHAVFLNGKNHIF